MAIIFSVVVVLYIVVTKATIASFTHSLISVTRRSLLLQDSIGGNSRTNLVANIHPSARFVTSAGLVYHACTNTYKYLYVCTSAYTVHVFIVSYQLHVPRNCVLCMCMYMCM